MSGLTFHKILVSQAVVPGLLFYRREKRALLRRWRRAMILPETVILVGLVMFGGFLSSQGSFRAGHSAMAAAHSGAMIETSPATKRSPRSLQDQIRQDPDMILTMGTGDIAHIFYAADFERHDGDVVMMQFRGQGCVLDIYTRQGRALYYELRSRNANDDRVGRPRVCIDDILKGRRTIAG